MLPKEIDRFGGKNVCWFCFGSSICHISRRAAHWTFWYFNRLPSAKHNTHWFRGWLFHTPHSKLLYVSLSIQLCRGRALSIVSQFRPSYVSVSSNLPLSDSLSLSHSTWLYTGGNIINHRDLSCCSLLIQRHKCNISLCHLKKQALQHCQCPLRNPEEVILVWAEPNEKKRPRLFISQHTSWLFFSLSSS